MCFSSPSMPKVDPARPAPTEREGNLEGVRKRQQAVGTTSNTNVTGGLGVTEDAKVYKPTLGS